MRQIKFRGKDSNGNWHYGDLEHSPIGKFCRIHEYRGDGFYKWHADVDPSTVGQFTGLKDKHGNEVYEGDILREPPKNEYDKENYVAYEVFWHDGDCASHHIGWQMNRCHFQGCICGTMYIPEFLPKTTARMEIIGNIHDNKNLLEKGGNR